MQPQQVTGADFGTVVSLGYHATINKFLFPKIEEDDGRNLVLTGRGHAAHVKIDLLRTVFEN